MSNEKIIALAERDVKKAEIALRNAETRPNIPPDELEHIKELLELRKEMLQVCLNSLGEAFHTAEWVLDDVDELGYSYKCSRCGRSIITNRYTLKPCECPYCKAKIVGVAI